MADPQAQTMASDRPEEVTGESSTTAASNTTSESNPLEQSSAGAAPAAPKTCANCSKPETDPDTHPLKPCTMCKTTPYCSRDCKKAHFKQHKKVCAALAIEYAKTADFKPASRSGGRKEGHRGGLQKWQFDT